VGRKSIKNCSSLILLHFTISFNLDWGMRSFIFTFPSYKYYFDYCCHLPWAEESTASKKYTVKSSTTATKSKHIKL